MKKTKHGDYELPIRFPVFRGFTIHVVVGKSIEESLAKRYGPDHEQKVDHAAAFTLGAATSDVHIFFRINRLYKPYAAAGDLAHESWHAIRQMFKYIGIGKNTGTEWPDNEAVAYHLGYTVERATRFFEEVRNDQRNTSKQSRPSTKKCS